MKLKDYIINFLFYSMLLALLGFWWCQLHDTVQKQHSKYVEVERQAMQAYDIQMQATVRIKALEDKIEILERHLTDFQVLFGTEDGMTLRDSSARMKEKIEHGEEAYVNCPYAQGNPPSIPAACTCPQ